MGIIFLTSVIFWPIFLLAGYLGLSKIQQKFLLKTWQLLVAAVIVNVLWIAFLIYGFAGLTHHFIGNF